MITFSSSYPEIYLPVANCVSAIERDIKVGAVYTHTQTYVSVCIKLCVYIVVYVQVCVCVQVYSWDVLVKTGVANYDRSVSSFSTHAHTNIYISTHTHTYI